MTKREAALNSPVFDEPWAVNLLVQIRKLVDSTGKLTDTRGAWSTSSARGEAGAR